MKKLVSVFLIVMLVINLTPLSRSRAGIEDEIADRVSLGDGVSGSWNSYMDEGSASVTSKNKDGSGSETKTEKKKISDTQTFGKTSVKTVTAFIIAIPSVLYLLISLATESNGLFCIADCLEGKYKIFDIEFWNVDPTSDHMIETVKASVAGWYVAFRNLSAIILIIIAIYIGIRMAISTVADEQARYKSMFISWAKGAILLMSLHLALIAIAFLAQIVVDAFANAGAFNKGRLVELNVLESLMTRATKNSSNKSALNSYTEDHPIYAGIVYAFMVGLYFRFFRLYLNRVLKVYFLVIISPMICVTYALDKVDDNKSQTFNKFISEYTVQILKLPIHVFIYCIFIASAGNIFESVPLLIVVFMFAMINLEKVIERTVIRAGAKFGSGLQEMKMGK